MTITYNRSLANAVKLILKPLIRLMIKHGITARMFADISREAFVEVTRESYAIPDKKLTAARIAVLTGLSRKEVKRIEDNLVGQSMSQLNRASRVLEGWTSDSEFLTTGKNPRSLPIFGDVGSFSALTARYSDDVTAGAIRDELLRVGAIEITSRNTVRLLTASPIDHDEIQKLEKIASRVSNYMSSAFMGL